MTLLVGPEKVSILAHRIILSAQSEVFRAMLKPGRMREGNTGVVEIPNYTESTVKRMLLYIYCNTMSETMKECSFEQLFELIQMADQYLIEPLKEWCLKIIFTKR